MAEAQAEIVANTIKDALKGTYYQSMDAKGRMTFPAKLREQIGERFIVTRGTDGCLFVYSLLSLSFSTCAS